MLGEDLALGDEPLEGEVVGQKGCAVFVLSAAVIVFGASGGVGMRGFASLCGRVWGWTGGLGRFTEGQHVVVRVKIAAVGVDPLHTMYAFISRLAIIEDGALFRVSDDAWSTTST